MCTEDCKAVSSKMNCAGRVLMGIFFIMAGIGKFMDPAGTAAYMASAGVPLSGVLVWVAAVFLIAAGVMLMVEKTAFKAAGLLGLFVILVTLLFHIGEGQMVMFLKNLAILGGLVVVMSTSCGGKICGGGKMKKGEA